MIDDINGFPDPVLTDWIDGVNTMIMSEHQNLKMNDLWNIFLFAGSDQADEDLTKGRGRGRDGQEGGEGGTYKIIIFLLLLLFII